MSAPFGDALRPREDLRETQHAIIEQIAKSHAKMIVSAMGSGKTGAVLTVLSDLLASGEARRILVVAPKFVAEYTWSDEIMTWAHTAGLSYAVCVGEKEERLAALRQRASITIINKDVLPWLAKVLKSVSRWPWDVVVIDESSMFKEGARRTRRARVKSADGAYYGVFFKGKELGEPFFVGDLLKGSKEIAAFKRREKKFWAPLGEVSFKRVRENIVTKVRKGGNMTRFGVLATARKRVKRVYELTGTPAPNGVEDLWGQVYLLDGGERLGRTKSEFRERWFTQNPYTKQWKPRPGAEEEIMAKVSDLIVSMPALKLVPEPVKIPVKVKLPAEAMDAYRKFEKWLYSEEYDVEAVSNGALANKLLQFANGSMYREDRSSVKIHDVKLDALDELIERAAGEPVLIFYSFQFDLEAIRKRHPDAVLLKEEDDVIRKWNQGKIKKLVAHPASCAHGLNMQYGGHIAIWFGLTWSLELWEQANARLPRPGQKNVVAIYQIIAEGTYDERVLEVLDDKSSTQQRVIESVMLDCNPS